MRIDRGGGASYLELFDRARKASVGECRAAYDPVRGHCRDKERGIQHDDDGEREIEVRRAVAMGVSVCVLARAP